MKTDQVKRASLTLPSEVNATGRNFGDAELEFLRQALQSGTLNCTKGTFVNEFEKRFAKRLGMEASTAVTSGTAAIHCAVAAVNPEPGDEIIGSPITDMGAITPILYQGAIPIFADVDPRSLLISAETIAPRITRRTKAIIVTHLFGNPCDMDPIMELAAKHKLVVIEDCAQAFMAKYKGRYVGTIGDIGCFSLQQSKHITTGEGGLVVSTNPDYARRMRLFHDKAWGYGDPKPDHYFLALNYRMTELQGAVGLAQLDKLDWSVTQRQSRADLLTERLREIENVHLPEPTKDSTHVYWKYCLNFEHDNVGDIAKLLREEYDIASAPRYIVKPAFMCEVLRDRNTFGNSHWPYEGDQRKNDPPVVYDSAEFPGTIKGLNEVLVLPWNEKYTDEHLEYIAAALLDVVSRVRGVHV